MFAPGSLAPVILAGIGSAATAVGVGVANREFGYPNFGNNKRKAVLQLTGGPVKKVRSIRKHRQLMRRRFRIRRRRGRRSFRKRRFGKRRSFTKRVRRVIRRTAEPKKVYVTLGTSQTFNEGDGTSRVCYILNPCSLLAQGNQANQFIGRDVFVKGISFRGQMCLSGETTAYAGCLVRITVFHSRENSGSAMVGPTFVQYNSTTTFNTNPTQTSPNSNPKPFAITGGTGFTGLGWVIPFDRSNVKVIASRTIVVNPGADNQAGSGITSIPTPFKFFFRINRNMHMIDPDNSVTSGQLGFKNGAYYVIVQAISNTNDTTATPAVECDYQMALHYSDP